MDAQRATTNIYIELDALLDTRLAVLNHVSDSCCKAIVKRPEYWTRTSDNFHALHNKVDQNAYQKAWDARTEATIKDNVGPTLLNAVIHAKVAEHIIDSGASPFNGDTIIHINTYPYEFDEAGRNALREMSRQNFMSECKIVYIPTDFLTPATIKNNYQDVYMYEFDKWLVRHFEELKENPMPSVYFYAPLLTAREVTSKKYCIIKDKEFLQLNLNAHLHLELLSVTNFCLYMRSETE